MRKICIILIIVVILPLFSLSVSAEERVDEYVDEFRDVIPEEYKDIAADPDALMGAVGIKGVLSEIISVLSGSKGEISSFFLTVLGALILMSLCSFGRERSEFSSVCVGIICSLLIFKVVSPAFGTVSDSLQKMSEFFSSLIPITVGVTALGGGMAGSGAQASGMYGALAVLNGLGGEIFTSLSAFALAMSLLSSFGSDGIASVARGIRSIFSWLLGIACALVTGATSLQTFVASAADSASMRAAKYMASGLIPAVGSTVSGALSTLASGLSYAKGIIGAGAIFVMISTVLSALVILLAYRAALSLGIILADFIGCSGAARIFSAYRFSLDTVVAVYCLSSVVCVFQIILFIKIGVALL